MTSAVAASAVSAVVRCANRIAAQMGVVVGNAPPAVLMLRFKDVNPPAAVATMRFNVPIRGVFGWDGGVGLGGSIGGWVGGCVGGWIGGYLGTTKRGRGQADKVVVRIGWMKRRPPVRASAAAARIDGGAHPLAHRWTPSDRC